MNVTALVCLANGSEETEAVTVVDLLARAGIAVTTASVNPDGNLQVICSRGVTLLADVALASVSGQTFDVIVLPGGLKGAEAFGDSQLLVDTLAAHHRSERLVAAICAAPALVLIRHDLFPKAKMTGFPGLKERIPADCWQGRRTVYEPRYNLLTSQGPATAIDFALHIISLLITRAKAAEVAAQLVLPEGIDDYRQPSVQGR